MKRTARETALDILLKIEKQHAYSQLVLNEALEHSELNQKDKALLTQLVYGVIQRKMTLNYYLQTYIKPNRKIEPWVRQLLYLSIYQKAFLTRIPDHAMVNEAVKIASKRGHKGVAGFVNGVLRQMLRQGLPDLSAIQPKDERLAYQYSHPQWLIKRWTEHFGEKAAGQICEANNQPPQATIRVNRLKTDVNSLIDRLRKEGIEAKPGSVSPDAAVILSGNAARTTAYQEGYFTIQDESSMLVAPALAPEPGMKVLDACAGPGGKTTHLAELMNNEGTIHALDLHTHKTGLIDQQVNRIGAAIVETRALDARHAVTVFGEATFDRILVDAPCTGFGVIRRKPEIKWEKTEEDVRNIANVQMAILSQTAPLLKSGGKLIYSTCTIERNENQTVVLDFLKNHPEFELDPAVQNHVPDRVMAEGLWEAEAMLQILPYQFETDGFFISCIRRK
ncbi:16S rRNA (cytosine967-C5)-methyltransferase [Scopulibacillus darangshiensis]|uniref:16S rRNA (cytosine(967)-C(5))-methyltransferase n=1 Tax=Scopulibacillus darangshiensis TaxID=442528 RepID=A0A4R2P334_9BACL|nr:16S rRNA (cytosine(967)-C(5))-methyltransferase RsmB [Scopulibacillus darangshiensis]TCP29130.1 16S rRNA (cytosine967-C5)-methyltransferase [Scopulibacillus darangshiensis]